MKSRQCAVCGRDFEPNPRVPSQSVCSEAPCQRERKRIWQQLKRRTDPDYRDNLRRSAVEWALRHPNYWEQYRTENPGYVEGNRRKQQLRNAKRQQTAIAKMDASTKRGPIPDGKYRLTALDGRGKATRTVWTVEITFLAGPSAGPVEIAK